MSDKALNYLATSDYLLDLGTKCFNHCVQDFKKGSYSTTEKNCTQGCINQHFDLFSSLPKAMEEKLAKH